MKKIILLFICIFLSAFYFLCESFNFINFTPQDQELKTLQCDLNTNDCNYMFNNQQINVSLYPKPIKSLETIKINIKNLNNCDEKIQLRIYGLNLYMGDIVYDIHKKDDFYEGDIILNSSLLNKMRFRVEIFNKEQYTGFYFDFDVENDIIISKCNNINC